MSLSAHVDDKKKYISVLGFDSTQGLNDDMLTVEAQYSINFLISNKNVCLIMHYKESNSFLFVNATKIYQFKAKNSEIRKYPLRLGNISEECLTNNMN